MADAVAAGQIEGANEATFRADVTCVVGEPSGFIRGRMEATVNGRVYNYSFHSRSATRVIARRSGIARYIYAIFRRATVHNLTLGFTTYGATIILTAQRNSTGYRSAILSIYRPGRVTLRASGHLDDGRTSVYRQVNCT
ncbi:MAG: hypothetical protein PHC92_07340 [Syntrophomonadaceae bacterium]|nr:hypothetical protein [Syntrophomonadaceae bacterium]MDD3024057.1 hypothetical protein [Syntrophomonadaceae bacterium]